MTFVALISWFVHPGSDSSLILQILKSRWMPKWHSYCWFQILVQTTKNLKNLKRTWNLWDIYCSNPHNPFHPFLTPVIILPLWNTTTMKNKNRLHLTFSTKTDTRHPKNIHKKPTITKQIKTNQNEIFKKFRTHW